MTFEYMKTIYHLIETRLYEGRTWYIYEHDYYGEDEEMIITDGNIYVYSGESFIYTMENLDEFVVYRFD